MSACHKRNTCDTSANENPKDNRHDAHGGNDAKVKTATKTRTLSERGFLTVSAAAWISAWHLLNSVSLSAIVINSRPFVNATEGRR